MTGGFTSPYLDLPLRSEAEVAARRTIAPPGNEVPRVLRDLKHQARGGGTVNMPAELALQMVEALEAGIRVGAMLENASRLPMPQGDKPQVHGSIVNPSVGPYAVFLQRVDALRQRGGR